MWARPSSPADKDRKNFILKENTGVPVCRNACVFFVFTSQIAQKLFKKYDFYRSKHTIKKESICRINQKIINL